MSGEPLVLLGIPLEATFVRRPWLVLVFVLACYVVGALIDSEALWSAIF